MIVKIIILFNVRCNNNNEIKLVWGWGEVKELNILKVLSLYWFIINWRLILLIYIVVIIFLKVILRCGIDYDCVRISCFWIKRVVVF